MSTTVVHSPTSFLTVQPSPGRRSPPAPSSGMPLAGSSCVVARSPEAKTVPVEMGAPLFELRDLVASGRVIALSSNYCLYGDLSHRVMSTLAPYGRQQEVYSIDECFLDLTDDGDQCHDHPTSSSPCTEIRHDHHLLHALSRRAADSTSGIRDAGASNTEHTGD